MSLGGYTMDQGNRALWKERIQEQASSGISMAAWCRQNHIKKSTFYYWKKQLHIESREIQSCAPQFAKLELPISPVPLENPVGLQITWGKFSFTLSDEKDCSLAIQFIRQVQQL